MTSVPLPTHFDGSSAKQESTVPKRRRHVTYADHSRVLQCERRIPRYHSHVPTKDSAGKMNMFQTISSFLRKNKKTETATRVEQPISARRGSGQHVQQQSTPCSVSPVSEPEQGDDVSVNNYKKVEEEPVEESEVSGDENKEDIAFVRATFRQSVKRAIGWRKSQRKAVNKRKKENIQNSKLLTGGSKDNDNDDEFYDDTELDVVVVTEADGIPVDCSSPPADTTTTTTRRTNPPASAKPTKIPKRRNSMRRPALSLKSSAFLSQSVASKRTDPVKAVTARTNKAAELREVAAKKKLESSPAPASTVPTPAPKNRKKARASFRTKKGMARKPLHKREIKPVENKASQLRARKTTEVMDRQGSCDPGDKMVDPKKSDRFSSAAVKTPAPGSENRDPLTYQPTNRNDSASSRVRNSCSESRFKLQDDDVPPTARISGKAAKTVPQKPVRSKPPSSSSSSSNIPTSTNTSRNLPVPPALSISKSTDDFHTHKYCGRSERTSSNINTKPRTVVPPSPTADPTKELVFIPLDSASLPLPGDRDRIDNITRKRKKRGPTGVSNIFNGGSGDLPCSSPRRQFTPHNDSDFTVHINRTTPAKSVTSTKRTSAPPKLSSSVPTSRSAKPKQVQNLVSNFKRQNSLESCRRTKKGSPVVSRLSESNSVNSESSDLENSCSYGSCKSLEDGEELATSLSDSLVLSDQYPRLRTTSVTFSTDDLENQKQKLRTPNKRSGSIRVKKVRSRKSWIRPESEIIDPNIDKVKALPEEVLIIEDLMSGNKDIIQKLCSRTQVLKNVTSTLRLGDTSRAARMAVSLCFPRSHPDQEFKTMKRACQCDEDDLAMFQNCLALLLIDREKLTLPIVTILLGKVRQTFQILGTDVLRGNVGEALKYITTNFGTKIVHRDLTPGINYRLQENAEECYKELVMVRNHTHKLSEIDCSPELMALKKHLELFDL